MTTKRRPASTIAAHHFSELLRTFVPSSARQRRFQHRSTTGCSGVDAAEASHRAWHPHLMSMHGVGTNRP